MNEMRTILDESDAEFTGESILSGARSTRVYVPASWTPEYAGYRMVEGYEVLRRANVGRIYPSGQSGFWPEIYHDAEDIKGWADEHRKQVEAAMARRQARPAADELARMDEVLAWPLRHLTDDPIEADAVTLWAFTTAWDIDPASILKWRKAKAEPIAHEIARVENEKRAKAREAAIADVQAWAAKEALRRRIAAAPALRRADMLDTLRTQARNRLEKAFKNLRPVKINPTLAMPGKVLGLPTLDRMRKAGLESLAYRLNLARIPVR